MVLFGYYGGDYMGHVWEWNGACWADTLPGSSAPYGLYYQAMAYDPVRSRMLRFGGEGPSGFSAGLFERPSM